MKCLHPYYLKHLATKDNLFGPKVGCGQCFACKQARRQAWAVRLMHEYTTNPDALFLTLTYDDDNLPENGTLVKADLQKYFKRVRKNLGDRRIKYYASGEYGERYDRPHYHAIVYGIGHIAGDMDLVSSAWPAGIVHMGTVTPSSCMYVAGYIGKVFYGDAEYDNYGCLGRIGPFAIMSQGLGKDFAEQNLAQLKQGLCTIGGVRHAIPRYYIKKFNIEVNNDEYIVDAMHHTCDRLNIGEYDSECEMYLTGSVVENYKYKTETERSLLQHDANIKAKCNLRKKKL